MPLSILPSVLPTPPHVRVRAYAPPVFVAQDGSVRRRLEAAERLCAPEVAASGARARCRGALSELSKEMDDRNFVVAREAAQAACYLMLASGADTLTCQGGEF